MRGSDTEHRFELEVCVDCIEAATIAVEAGATRIELNSALALDGLTPSLGASEYLVQNCDVPILAMLRPHDRGFVYSSAERGLMQRDCEQLLSTGVAGIVVGGLTDNARIDDRFLEQLVRQCESREVVFHMAFDAIDNQRDGLETLIDNGVRRVLTSGGAKTAEAGMGQLRDLIEQAHGRIEILPGGGVTSANARRLIEQTGCTQLHGSFGAGKRDLQGAFRTEIRKTLAAIGQLSDSRFRS